SPGTRGSSNWRATGKQSLEYAASRDCCDRARHRVRPNHIFLKKMEPQFMPQQRVSRIDSRALICDARVWLMLLILALAPIALISEEKTSSTTINVDASKPGGAISPQMFGVFFEDINFAADGGLYPELVKNRSFEFNQPLNGWHEVLTFNAKGLAS